MSTLNAFADDFNQLTGHRPFPWQTALYDRFCKGPDHIPRHCNLPTGTGKTSVIACWLLARRVQPRLPRRLVYVVNRRTVVDQTTAEVERCRQRWNVSFGEPLAISTLRGQFADNREWSADPTRPAVICGTVDMIGSRLLFSGYGIGRNLRPHHAGLLGQDTLIVHDEAHLEPAFEKLLDDLALEQTRGRFPDLRPLRVMSLTATSREHDGNGDVFQLTESERTARPDSGGLLGELGRRLHATKRLQLHQVAEEKADLAERIAELARQYEDRGCTVLIYVRELRTLAEVVDQLPRDRTEQLTGTLRGLERDRLVEKPVFQRFLPGAATDQDAAARNTVYLVSTSAGEVGVNLSADHLVCDLVPFDAMAQRLGRVNRFGRRDDTEVHVVHPGAFDAEDTYDAAREKTLELLRRLEGNASPAALLGLSASDRAAAFTPPPQLLVVSDILFDAWACTTPRGDLPGRPPVEPFLHGLSKSEPPETYVAFREEVRLISRELASVYDPEELLERYPLLPHELLRDRSDRIRDQLKKLAEKNPDAPAWRVAPDGRVEVATLAELSGLHAEDKRQVDARLQYATVVLPHDIGGLSAAGLLDANAKPEDARVADPFARGLDVSSVLRAPPTPGDEDIPPKPLRLRVLTTEPTPPDTCNGISLADYRPVCRLRLTPIDADDDTPVEYWHWLELPGPTDNSRYAREPVLLDVHAADVLAHTERYLSALQLPDPVAQALRVAAKAHDLGKRRPLFQATIGRPEAYDDHVFAKSGPRWTGIEGITYRHEFGSLLDLQADPDFKTLSPECRDLALHLIAAHHGRARPCFEPDEAFDPASPDDLAEAEAVEVVRRFARLQRRYGRWGLAYLESLLRAADYAASAAPSATFSARTPAPALAGDTR
ncbi:MAG: type I-U CRISPR-associated helicase/endonuclease Cas3 [Tepidisphaerales bacterium]